MIKKYIKLPIPIEAVQWGGHANYPIDEHNFLFDESQFGIDGEEVVLIVHTWEGDMKAYPGDYIVRGVDGEYYPVKKEIFEKTYVEAKEDEEFVSVRKDRLEEMVEAAYDDSSFCPLVKTSVCKWKSSGSCSHCKYDYADIIRHESETVKNVIKWLEGE